MFCYAVSMFVTASQELLLRAVWNLFLRSADIKYSAKQKGPWSDGNRTISDRFNIFPGQKLAFCLIDEAPFEFVTGPNGKKIMLSPEEAQAIRDRRIKSPRPPKIQQDLLEARQLKECLEKTPGLTKTDLAAELGISRFELIRRLNLLRLAPEIQDQIFAMPPRLTCRGPMSKRTLRNIAVIMDFEVQKKEFGRLTSGSAGGQL